MIHQIRGLILPVALVAALLGGSPAVSQDATQQDLKVISFNDLYATARNTLAWQKIAGQFVAVTGGRFFGITQSRFNGKDLTLLQLSSSKSDFDLISCFLAPESMNTAATFKKGDPVNLAGKLAGAPNGYRPAFDGPCIAVAPNKQKEAAADAAPAGGASAVATMSLMEYNAARERNNVAFEQKYQGKVIAVTGGKVGDIHADYVEITAPVGAAGNQRQAPFLNCFPAPSAKAAVADLGRGQQITVTGLLKRGDLMRAINGSAILDNCTWK
jgi:hypothetical protein